MSNQLHSTLHQGNWLTYPYLSSDRDELDSNSDRSAALHPQSDAQPRPPLTLTYAHYADGLSGDTLTAQLETEQATSAALTAHASSFATPTLNKSTHLAWLAGIIQHPLPQGYTSLDASRPWLLYWVLHSFAMLGGQLDQPGKDRVVETILACQCPTGGFGGGPGQLPHLAPTYAAICALAYAGEAGWDKVNR